MRATTAVTRLTAPAARAALVAALVAVASLLAGSAPGANNPPPGSLSGSVVQSIVKPVDVTAAGTTDWAVWGYGSSPSNQPASALTPSETKANGGRQIGDLSIVNGDGTPVRGFGSYTGSLVPFDFSWTDGSPDTAVSGGYAGLTAPKLGQGLSLTVPADTTPRKLTIWTSAHYADGTLTAHLSDGSAPDYTQTIHAVQGDFTSSGENAPAIFTLDYNAASAGQHLTVSWTQSANNGCGGCEDVVLYAAALSGGGNAIGASASFASAPSVEMPGSVPISDIPLAAFDPQPPGAPPISTHGLQLNQTQLNQTQLNQTQLNQTQLNQTQLNQTQLNQTQLNQTQLNQTGLTLNEVPLDPNRFPDGWTGLLQYTTLADQPLQTITLHDVLSLTTADVVSAPAGVTAQSVIDEIQSLTFADLVLQGSPLGQITVGALVLGGAEVNQLGSGLQDAIEVQLHDWCLSIVPAGDPHGFCTGTDPGIGYLTLIQLGLLGAPVQALQLNQTQLNQTQLNQTQLNQTPVGHISTSASGILGMQLSRLDLGPGVGIGDLAVGSLPVAVRESLFDCTNPVLFDCALGTLAQAQAAGAINPTTTVGDLDVGDFFADVTIGQLLESVLGPASAYKDVADFGDVVGLFLRSADVKWESLPPDLLAVFDPSRGGLTMSAGFTIQGTGTPPAEVAVDLPAGFDFVPSSATLSENGGGKEGVADPSITSTGSGYELVWHLDSVDAGMPYALSFAVFAGTTVGPTQATETVSSGGHSDSSIASFSVTDSFPGDGTATTATPVDTAPGHESVEMSTLPTPGAVDYYTFPMPAAGTRIQVHLTNLPADYDLALYAPRSTSVRTSATSAPPLQDGIVPDQQVNLTGGSSGQLTPTGLEDVPNPGIPLVQLSDNRRMDDEDVGMVSPGGGGSVTVAVFGYNGAFGPKAYTLRVRESAPPPTEVCAARSFPHHGEGTTPDSLPDPSSLPASLNTVILVDEKRLGDTYGAAAEANALEKLHHLAGDASLGVSGVVVPVETIPGVQSLYDTWDSNPCDPSAANAVANPIADEVAAIKAVRPGVRYVVFGGGDDQIPFFRLPDLSLIANESGFAGQFGPNEYQGSLAAGNLLSDDPYLDTQPVPASGQQLFPPNLAGGRLVETAQDIANAVDAFEHAPTPGVLKSSTGFVSGYDFVADGSQRVADNLAALGVSVRTLDNPLSATSDWGLGDLLGAAFPAGGVADINSWNGHYDNYRTQMANGDILSTSGLPAGIGGGIFFTMGCHAGFQTTDAVVGTSVLDWAQYFAEHGTGFVGNTGYGLGDTDSVAFSEELMSDFAGKLNGSLTLGQALMQAKQQYYLSRVAFGNYDEKTLSEAELYGLPMYGVGRAPSALSASTGADPVSGATQSTSPSQGPLATFPGANVQSASFAATPHFVGPITGQYGDYYANDGQVQAPNYRPLQPYLSLPAGRSGLVAHGVVVDGLTSEDHVTDANGNPWVPDNVRPTLNSSGAEPPPTFTDEAWPEKIPTLVSLGEDQSLNLITGQFFTRSGNPTGVERLWKQIDGRVTYSTSQDFTPPTVDSIDAFQGNGVVSFSGRFSDLDQAGSPGVVAFAQVVYDDGSGHWTALRLHFDPASGTWAGGVPFSGSRLQYFVEACDAAGNCGYSSNKGRYFDAQPLQSSSGTLTLLPSRPPDHTSWYAGSLDVTATSSAQTVEVSLDGGAFTQALGPLALTTDGVHVVAARDSAGDSATATYLIDTVAPDPPRFTGIEAKLYPVDDVPGAGAVGCTSHDSLSGLQSCVVAGYSAALGTHVLTATATDNAGNTSTSTLVYTVGFRAGDILPPVAAKHGDQTDPSAPDLRVMETGRTVPLKFRFYLDAAETVPMTTPPAGSFALLTVAKYDPRTASSTDVTRLVRGRSDSGDRFRWTGPPDDEYIYGLATSKLAAGLYYCTITLYASDGTTVLGRSARQYFVLR